MLYYRLYFMHRFSGHIEHYREFEAENDEVAVATAERWREGGPMELWNLERKLKHWDEETVADDG
ncbi:MAG: hypothetical protein QOD54_163 [Sphingomonadales bacterium]|nr:hypothetical protein [Sphingomonadales bacterium]